MIFFGIVFPQKPTEPKIIENDSTGTVICIIPACQKMEKVFIPMDFQTPFCPKLHDLIPLAGSQLIVLNLNMSFQKKNYRFFLCLRFLTGLI